MDFINQLFSIGSSTIVIIGAFLICLIGYAIGHIQFKGICLGTAGVFLVALLFGYLFTLPVLQEIPLISKFYVEDSSSSVITNYKFFESIGLILFVTSVGFIAGPSFFHNMKKIGRAHV